MQAVTNFQVHGQLAVATPSEGFSANLLWQQQGVASDLLLRAPLGLGGARLNFDGEELRMTNSQGTQLQGVGAQEELVRVLGFEPPLRSLRYWLLGTPGSGQRLPPRHWMARNDWRNCSRASGRLTMANTSRRPECGCRVVWLCIAAS